MKSMRNGFAENKTDLSGFYAIRVEGKGYLTSKFCFITNLIFRLLFFTTPNF